MEVSAKTGESLKDAIINLYLDVKVRSDEQVSHPLLLDCPIRSNQI